jgi:hypothetical protein
LQNSQSVICDALQIAIGTQNGHQKSQIRPDRMVERHHPETLLFQEHFLAIDVPFQDLWIAQSALGGAHQLDSGVDLVAHTLALGFQALGQLANFSFSVSRHCSS